MIFHDLPVTTSVDTPPETNINTKDDGLEDVSQLKHGYFGYPGIHVSFRGCSHIISHGT